MVLMDLVIFIHITIKYNKKNSSDGLNKYPPIVLKWIQKGPNILLKKTIKTTTNSQIRRICKVWEVYNWWDKWSTINVKANMNSIFI